MKSRTGFLAWAVLALLALFGDTQAQTATPPWDQAPMYCNDDNRLKYRVCKLRLLGGEAAPHLRSYGKRGEFDRLEWSLRNLADSKGYFTTRHLKSSAVYAILEEFADAQVRAGSTPEGQILANWKKAVPGSEFVLLAEAIVLRREAWEARGEVNASTVSESGWKLYDEKMRAAEQMLLAARPRLKELAAWHLLLLRISFEGRGMQSKWPDVLETALDRWPTYIEFHETAALHMSPRWGGSWAAVESFIVKSTERVAATEGTSYYARLYSIFGDVLVTDNLPLDWRRLRPAFDDWIERAPTVYALNRYAAFACQARDWETYSRHIATMTKEEIDDAPWLPPGYIPEFCNRWASRTARDEAARVDPWDKPPDYCAGETGQKIRVCKLGLPGGEATTYLRSYAVHGEFNRLDRLLRKLADSRDYFMDRRFKGLHVYLILNEFAHAQIHEGINPRGQILAKWKKAVPGSEFVLLAEAMVLYAEAWQARGGGFASTVSASGWEVFGEKMRAAEQMLLAAPPRLKETAAWNSLLLKIAFEGRGVQSKWPDVLEAALRRWPTYIGFYENTVLHIGPKWGGSWATVDAFIEQSTRRVSATEGRSYYARLYSILDDDLVSKQLPLNWSKMKPAFDDWIERGPTPYALNRYAAFACFARDKQTYRKHMATMTKEEIIDGPWLEGYTHESCNLWASR